MNSDRYDSQEFFQVTDTLDLHGFFPEQVEEVVHEFIRHAMELNLNEVKIIHGKGRSRLKFEVYRVLSHHPDIIQFGDAPPCSGGWGATLIQLKIHSDES